MEGKSFEEGLAEITETLKRLQSTLLFHQTKLNWRNLLDRRVKISHWPVEISHWRLKTSQIDKSSNKGREFSLLFDCLLAFHMERFSFGLGATGCTFTYRNAVVALSFHHLTLRLVVMELVNELGVGDTSASNRRLSCIQGGSLKVLLSTLIFA
ncbi:hypothetical protein Tco_1148949 [Tanacetum coccineum]